MKIRTFVYNRKSRFWVFQIYGWLLFGAIDLYASSKMLGLMEMDYKQYIILLFSVFFGFCISLILRYLYRRVYLKRYSIVTYTIVSLFTSIVGSLIWLAAKDITELLIKLGMPYSIWTMWSESGFFDYILFNVMALSSPLFIWSFLYFGYKLTDDLRTERNKHQESLLMAKEAQLQILRYQINPHFLFNSLSSIQALMYKDTPQADEMLTEFSEFLRYTLKNKDDIYVNLEDEIEIISKYLYIEKIRFQEKLKYVIDIRENTRHIKVLSFLLQPFVENAIKHGLKANNDSLIIEITCKSEENKLFVTIKNSGKWDNKNLTKGIGIENVKNRLKTAYSGKHILEIKEENGWVIIKIQIDLING